MTAFTYFGGGSHFCGVDGRLVFAMKRVNKMLDVASFARDLDGDVVSADMAFHAFDLGMWRSLVRDENRRHGMTAVPAECGTIGVFPPRASKYKKKDAHQYDHAIWEKTLPEGHVGIGREETADSTTHELLSPCERSDKSE